MSQPRQVEQSSDAKHQEHNKLVIGLSCEILLQGNRLTDAIMFYILYFCFSGSGSYPNGPQ